MRSSVVAALAALALGGCSSIVHGPMQDVRVESNPPGAGITIFPQQSQRGPLFLDDEACVFEHRPPPGRIRLAVMPDRVR